MGSVKMWAVVVTAVAVAVAPGAGWAGKVVTPTDLLSIVEVFQELGEVNLGRDSAGDPKLSGVVDGVKYQGIMYKCTDGRDCKVVLLRASWSITEDKPSLSFVNKWNAEKLFGRAFIDKDGDPGVDLAVNLEDGVTLENLKSTARLWRIVLKQYSAALAER
jgi:hypothetical protein